MSFDVRISLKAPNGYTMLDKTFKFATEIDARDMCDILMMIADRNYYDTFEEYKDTIKAVSRILEGYEYAISSRPRRKIVQDRRL